MFNLGTEAVYTADDDWTVLTEDHQPSAHFEHTILITEDGSEPLTEMLGTPVW
jgi:methionyl aminopeptidase